MQIFVLFILGLCVGSFLNVLIYRINEENVPKFWQGRSICPNCKHQLSWQDNIPLLSYIFLKGKCHYCHKKISIQYPIVELVTAISFVVTGLHPVILALVAVFIVIFFSDIKYMLIPDEMVIIGSVATLIYNLQFTILNQFQILNFKFQIPTVNLLTGIVAMSAFMLIVLLTRFKGMGLGDVKLAFLMGFLLGFPKILTALWISFVLGGIYALALLLLKKTKLSATIPLGPFLVIGTLISALWSNILLKAVIP